MRIGLYRAVVAALVFWGLCSGGSAAALDVPSLSGVTAIMVEGNQRIDTAAVRAQIKSVPGKVTPEGVSADIKSIYNTGFFSQVTASLAAGDRGGDVLKFAVVEKPVVRKVFIKGNEEVSEKDLADVLKFGTNRFLDKARIEALMRSATVFYQGKGFYDASFDYVVVPVSDNQVDLTFNVSEGQKFKITSIEFRGLREVDEDELHDTMQTREHSWYKSWLLGTGRLNKEMLENDRALLRQWMLDHGYLDGVVSEPQIEVGEGTIKITFDVQEGQRYSIGAVTASGDLLDADIVKTLEGIKTESGEVFSASSVREDSFKISDKFSDRGYAFANVVPGTSVDKLNGTVAIDFAVSQGNPVSINRIKIRGNDKTYDNVIRRELRVEEQRLYSGVKVRRSQQLLERTGFFEEVSITSEPTGVGDTVDLLVNVREGSTGSFSVGAGYSSADGALFNARLTENNFFGRGRSATINADIGTERNNLVLAVKDPRFHDSFWAVGADILKSEREYDDFDRDLAGGGVEVGYPLGEVFGEWAEDISFSLQYEYLDVEISNVDEEDAAQLVIDSEGKSTSSAFTPRLVRNTINNPLNPTSGSKQVLSLELAGVGGNQEYYLLEARNVLYHPLLATSFGEFVFSWRTSFGYGESYDDEPFPLFKRFFPGGINSVRGYKNRTLGPKDEDGNEYGGSKELVNNLEVIFPLINSAGFKGVVFYDIGNAFDDGEAIDLGELREAYGYGIRWSSPVGPIRVEFGFPIDREEGESSMVTMFSFGAPL
ncbi:MAG: hypothetical protein RL417_1580 [Pseudomonadota bacterium]|jgi:outer membrane protein insertion porin family